MAINVTILPETRDRLSLLVAKKLDPDNFVLNTFIEAYVLGFTDGATDASVRAAEGRYVI